MKFVKLFVAVSILGILLALLLYSMRYEIARLKEGLPGFTHALGDEYFEMVKMNDGVLLATSIHLPDSLAPFPTVLIRSPYARFEAVLRDQVCGRFVRYGYACVFQDTRGQGDSEGVWDPGLNEVEDGRDTLTWLVGQDFQNGKIAMMGPSYLTLNQYAAAAGGLPEEVKTFVPSVFAADMRDALYADGMFRHETFTAWASMNRTSNTAFQGTGKDYQAAIRHYPHEEVDKEIFNIEMPWYQRMIDIEQSENAFYGEELGRLISETPERLKVPVLMIGGWYDVFTGPQIKDWDRLSTQSSSRFVIGPWTHAGSAGSAFELNNAGGGLFQWHEMLDWFSHHLKGEELKSRLGVNVYVMGKNEWRHYDEWPSKTESASYSLSHEIDSGDCSVHDLVAFSKREKKITQIPLNFEYDPRDPLPTRGGSGMLAFLLPGYDGAEPGNVLQRPVCERADVISYRTKVLEEDLLISGKIRTNLIVSSSAPDTSFTFKLIEEFADGRAINIRDAITSLAYRNGSKEPSFYEPGQKLEIEIVSWPIEWRVSAGSRLRLDISSSNFPKYHAHSNRAGPWAKQVGTDLATQTLYGGELVLPLSPVDGFKGL